MGEPHLQNQTSEDTKFNLSTVVAALLLAASLVLTYLFFSSNQDQNNGDRSLGKSIKNDLNAQQIVNKHLAITSQKFQLQQQKTHLDNEKTAREFYETKAAKPYESDSGLNLEVEKNIERPGDFESAGNRNTFPTDPNQYIQTKILEEQRGQEYTEAYKKEYARQFIENARRNGWEVKLSEDYKVISVRPIQLRQQMQLFDPNSN